MVKDLIIKYVWLVDTIYKAGQITFEEINQKWIDQEMDDKPIAKRTFHKWRNAIEEIFDLNIECKREGNYPYYIENKEDIKRNTLRNWLLKTLSVSNLLMNSQTIKNRILLEEIPSGQEHLSTVMEALKTNTRLRITYHGYGWVESNPFDVDPFCVKLFRQRWDLVARSATSPYKEKGPHIYAFDRILSLQTTGETFEMSKDWDAEAFFEDCFGIITDQSVKVQTVKLKVSAWQANYIRDLKLHETQEEIERNEEYSIFSLRIRPTFDFLQELLWNGERMEVLEPLELRKEIGKKIELMWNKYKQE